MDLTSNQKKAYFNVVDELDVLPSAKSEFITMLELAIENHKNSFHPQQVVQ